MKKWGIILGSSMVATAALNLFSSIPTLAPILLFVSVMGGAAWATYEEIKQDVKEMKKEHILVTSYQMEKEYAALQSIVMEWEIPALTDGFKEVMAEIQKLLATYHTLTQSEKMYVQHTLAIDIRELLRAFEAFHPNEKIKQSQELIDVFEKVSLQLKEIYNQKQREAEDIFHETKRVIQEKLTRY